MAEDEGRDEEQGDESPEVPDDLVELYEVLEWENLTSNHPKET